MEDHMGSGVPVALRCLVRWVRGWGAWDASARAEGFVACSGVETVGVVRIKAVADGEPGYGGRYEAVGEGCCSNHGG